MKIIRKISNGVVIHTYPDEENVRFTDRGLAIGSEGVKLYIKQDSYEVLTVHAPESFTAGVMTYIDDVWAYANASDSAKAALLKVVEAKAEALEDTYILVDGKPVPTDFKAQGRIANARSILARGGNPNRIVKFPGLGSLTVAELTVMEDAVFDYVTLVHDRHSDLYDEIMASDDLNTIDVYAGWPE